LQSAPHFYKHPQGELKPLVILNDPFFRKLVGFDANAVDFTECAGELVTGYESIECREFEGVFSARRTAVDRLIGY
jgi:hypothetical protein